jgi:predicted ABC-type ATPase
MRAPKQLWVLAGANGAGKSTFYRTSLLAQQGVRFLNADLMAQQIDPEHPERVSYEAAHLIEKFREEILHKGISFCFETVFSHPSKIDFIAKARSLGYQVILVYIHLTSLDLNEARVHQRISEGGHSVPAEKIRSRLPRTLKNVALALPLADEARLLDNSSRERPFQPVARILRGRRVETVDPLPAWAAEMLSNTL